MNCEQKFAKSNAAERTTKLKATTAWEMAA
jgi:hypothetical protein